MLEQYLFFLIYRYLDTSPFVLDFRKITPCIRYIYFRRVYREEQKTNTIFSNMIVTTTVTTTVSTALLPPILSSNSSDPYFTGKWYWYALILLVALSVADNVLVVILFDTFGERYAQYLNQGTAFVYIVWSSLILLYRKWRLRNANGNTTKSSSSTSTTKTTAPRWVLIGIGLFNGTGNFLMAISQPHTPGLTQTLLNLLGIPLVLVMSSIFLGKVSSKTEWLGALCIVIGTCVSGMRIILQPADAGSSSTIVAYFGSVLFYASAQLFLSGEKVWEESSFTKFSKLDPMVMFWYTLVTQFMLGWFLYPLQTIPAFGNISLADIPSVIGGGVLCTFGDSSSSSSNSCGIFNTIIFFGYCSIDFWCYFFGLWVIQKGGANLMVITIAIALPLQQLVLCTKFLLGKFSETFFWGDSVALILVLFGFCLYQYANNTNMNTATNKKPQSQYDIRRNNTVSSQARSEAIERIDSAKTEAREKAAARRMSSTSLARSTLHCVACEELEKGMCDNCREIFKSDEWIKLHPEWKEKQEREKRSPTKHGW